MEWELGVVGWGKRGGSCRGKGRVGDAFSTAENACFYEKHVLQEKPGGYDLGNGCWGETAT